MTLGNMSQFMCNHRGKFRLSFSSCNQTRKQNDLTTRTCETIDRGVINQMKPDNTRVNVQNLGQTSSNSGHTVHQQRVFNQTQACVGQTDEFAAQRLFFGSDHHLQRITIQSAQFIAASRWATQHRQSNKKQTETGLH